MSVTVADVAVVRAGLSPVMVGRVSELRRLRAAAADLSAVSEPRVVLVSGDAGVGKSRLVRELLGALGDVPAFVGHAEPDPFGRPFHVVQSALRAAVAQWSEVPADLASRAQALRVLLAPVAPALSAEAGSSSRLAGDENLAAAVELVRRLLDGRPGVLVAEDLHWADAESLLLLGRLATTPDLPLLLVGTFRPMAENRKLADLLDRVARQRMVDQIELSPLDERAVAEWLGAVYQAPISLRVASDLARRTSGNPFFLEELVASAPNATVDELCGLPLPASISEAVLRHLDGLDPAQRRIADAAAVLGRRVPFDLLAAITGAGEDMLIETLRLLLDRGLLVEIEPDLFSFRHALTREAIAHRLLGRQRRRLHEKAHAALLEMGSDDWGALAYHACGANLWDDVVAAARRGAAVHLRTGSTYEALRLAELGLQEADDDAELLALATRAAWACGLTPTALSYATQWTALMQASGDDAERARALRTLSRLRWETHDMAGRDDVLDRLLVVADRLPEGPDLAEVYAHLAEVRMLGGKQEEAIEWADRAIALSGPDGVALPAAMVNKGSALLDVGGRFDDGAALLVEAIDVAVRQSDAHNALRGINNLLGAAFVRWPAERLWRLVGRAQELTDRFGWRGFDFAENVASYHLEAMGDLAAGRAVLDDALADPLGDHRSKRAWLCVERAWLAIESGEPTVNAFVADARAATSSVWAAGTAASADWLETLDIALAARAGDAAAASAALSRLEKLPGSMPQACSFDVWAWGLGLLAALRAGVDPHRVAAVFATAIAAETRGTRDQNAGWRCHIDGAIAAALGDHAAAVGLLREALELPRRRPGVVLEADVRVTLAKSLLSIGELDEARRHLEAAEQLLAHWAGWRVDELDALRRRIPDAAASRASAGVLTARERDVAELVARGLSNGEIGRELYISTKTASVHVSNILAKLGMTSRAQIAAWASSDERAGSTTAG